MLEYLLPRGLTHVVVSQRPQFLTKWASPQGSQFPYHVAESEQGRSTSTLSDQTSKAVHPHFMVFCSLEARHQGQPRLKFGGWD